MSIAKSANWIGLVEPGGRTPFGPLFWSMAQTVGHFSGLCTSWMVQTGECADMIRTPVRPGVEFESVERFREADEQSWREANQLLEKFDLLRLYYGEGGQSQWNNEQDHATTVRADKKEKRGGAASAAAAAASAPVSASAVGCALLADAKRE